MSWITDIFSSSVGVVVKEVGTAIDNLVTSDKERLELRNALATIELQAQNKKDEIDLQYDKEVTDRWKSDNEHTVTRLVRPAIVIWSFALLTIVILMDGNAGNFTVREEYIPLIGQIVIASVVAYMGARTFDKHSINKHKAK